MIKLTYNGFVIEADSIADVLEIINQKVKEEKVEVKKLGRPVGSVVKKKKIKKHTKAKWGVDEINAILTALDNGSDAKQLMRYSPLRERHSKSAILQMVNKVLGNNQHSSISKEVSQMIQDWHSLRGTRIPVRSVA